MDQDSKYEKAACYWPTFGKCYQFCKQVFVHRERSFYLFSTSLLPPRTLSSPPCPEMDAGGGGHWTNSSITLTRLLGGNLTLVLVCCNHPHSQLGLWTRMILSFWQPAYTFNGEPYFPFQICLILVPFHVFSDSTSLHY